MWGEFQYHIFEEAIFYLQNAFPVLIAEIIYYNSAMCFKLFLWNYLVIHLTEDEEIAPTRDVSRHFEDTSYGYKDFSRHGMHVPTFRVQVSHTFSV